MLNQVQHDDGDKRDAGFKPAV
ncbi:MAG: hypothetical protein JWR77_951, partial [Rhizorhabdus sp.]|nr:hypothetical protein [Rhizorhabdus sp.]